MCGNRVEELEARVKELEASIEGLTDELVECKVRLREMEGAVDEDLGFESGDAGDGGDPSEDDGTTDIVDAGPEEAEGSKPAGTQEGDDTEESDADDDIIVA